LYHRGIPILSGEVGDGRSHGGPILPAVSSSFLSFFTSATAGLGRLPPSVERPCASSGAPSRCLHRFPCRVHAGLGRLPPSVERPCASSGAPSCCLRPLGQTCEVGAWGFSSGRLGVTGSKPCRIILVFICNVCEYYVYVLVFGSLSVLGALLPVS
jgi:hypothetical protein